MIMLKRSFYSHSSRQHVPVATYRENMKQIISAIRGRGMNQIVLLTAPPIYEPGRKEHQISVRSVRCMEHSCSVICFSTPPVGNS